MSSIEDDVCFKILKRSDIGKKRYGVTMERDDLTRLQWSQHTWEELMDACVYIQKLISIEEKIIRW